MSVSCVCGADKTGFELAYCIWWGSGRRIAMGHLEGTVHFLRCDGNRISLQVLKGFYAFKCPCLCMHLHQKCKSILCDDDAMMRTEIYMMMTSSNGNIFHVTGPLWGEFTGQWGIPIKKASDAELWCFLWSAPDKQLCKQSRRWWFETPSRSLWRHCSVKGSCLCAYLCQRFQSILCDDDAMMRTETMFKCMAKASNLDTSPQLKNLRIDWGNTSFPVLAGKL